MKKTSIILSFILACSSFIFAQGGENPSQSKYVAMEATESKVNDAATEYLTLNPSNFYEVCSFQIVLTKITGTPDGIAKLQSSNDGINFIDNDAADTLSIANVTTQTKVFTITHGKSVYYRIAVIGRGTQSTGINGYFWGSGLYNEKTSVQMLSSYSLTSDTATNTGTTYLQTNLNKYWHKAQFQAVVTKISGTAAGTVTLQGSVDGVNYVTVSTDYATSVTMTVTNVTTTTKFMTVTSSPYRYYRLSYTGSGTMSCSIKGSVSLNN
jgi:hypothetical protein